MGSEAAQVYVVTGASRGLGLEFVKQLLQKNHEVVATARNPESSKGLQALDRDFPHALTMVPLDVSEASSIKAAAEAIASKYPNGIDVLINNAGIGGSFAKANEQNEEEFKSILFTNVLGPFLVIKSLLPLIRKGNVKQIVQISSGLGSIDMTVKQLHEAEPHPLAGMSLAYRTSKAALNMETASLAVDLKKDGITIISMAPGWVATDMGTAGADAMGVAPPTLDAPTSIAGMLKVMDGLMPEQSGAFLNYEGRVMPF